MSRVPITLSHAENSAKLRPMIGAVIYVRVSTKEQTENLSLPTLGTPARSTAGARDTKSLSGSGRKARARRPRTAPNCRSC